MHNFKVGDRVRIPETLNPQWAGEGVIKEPVNHNIMVTVQMTSGQFAGSLGGFSAQGVELLEPTEPTDQELADEYRKTLRRQLELSLALQARGFKRQWRNVVNDTPGLWKEGSAILPAHLTKEYRFIKTITEETVV